jgi:hypothetical protein
MYMVDGSTGSMTSAQGSPVRRLALSVPGVVVVTAVQVAPQSLDL